MVNGNRDTTDYSHGSTGQWPNGGTDYQSGDTLYNEELDKVFYYLVSKVQDIIDEFNAIDSDNDGIVDEADYANDADASTYKGTDIDSDGDGIVNQADDSNTLAGKSAPTVKEEARKDTTTALALEERTSDPSRSYSSIYIRTDL